MKKVVSLILLLIIAMMGTCLAEQAAEKPLGHLTKLGVEEAVLNAQIRSTFEEIPFSEYRYFDNLNSMVMALDSGDIDGFLTTQYTYEFLRARINRYSTFSTDPPYEYAYGYAMLLRQEDQELCNRITEAIREMKADGTLDALKEQYIDKCIAGEEPAAVRPEVFDKPDTLTVALTGDLPPMDYFSAEGKPVGFNTALISEIGKRLAVNIELISIDSGSRAVSLASGKSDVVFWTEAADYYNWDGAAQEDQPENTLLTDIYLPAEIRIVVLKTFPAADP